MALQKFNLNWLEHPLQTVSEVQALIAKMHLESQNAIGLGIGEWNQNGTASLEFNSTVYKTFINAVKNIDSTIPVFALIYGDAQDNLDSTNQATRANMVNTIKTVLDWNFDGYIDDNEETNSWAGLIQAWHEIASAVHSKSKISSVYYGLDYSYDSQATSIQVLKSFTDQDFAFTRFSPLTAQSNQMYDDVVKYCATKWLPQVRAPSSNREGESIQSSIDFFTPKFANGFPSNFIGFSVWAWGYMTEADWLQWHNWQIKNFPIENAKSQIVSYRVRDIATNTTYKVLPEGEKAYCTEGANCKNDFTIKNIAESTENFNVKIINLATNTALFEQNYVMTAKQELNASLTFLMPNTKIDLHLEVTP
jgi:hypothetical protein